MRVPFGVPIVVLATVLAGCITGLVPATVKTGAPSLSPDAWPNPDAFAQNGNWSTLLEAPLFAAKTVQVVQVASFDGTKINMGLYLPDVPNGTRVPVVLDAGPYFGNGEGPVDHVDDQRLSLFLIKNFVPQGFAVALMSVRGTGNSGGCGEYMGQSEQKDLDAMITWLATQPWSNGNVAQIGKSYDGATVWESAASGNPHLKTIVPISGIPDMALLHFTNGTSESRAPILWAVYWTFGLDPKTQERDNSNRLASFCPYVAQALSSATFSSVTGDMNDPTGFWAERNFEPNVEKNYHGSVYVVHGLQDWNVHSNVVLPWVDSLNLSTKILLGQWDHAYPDRPQFNVHATRYDWAESLLHWFDRYLRNDTTAVTGPRVDVEDNRGEWRTETSFPPTDARFATFYLASGQTLADAPGGSGQVLIGGLPAGTETGIVPVPAPVSPPPGTTTRDAWFTTGPLASDLRFSGLPQVPLTVTPLGPGGHVRVELYDISPNGSQLLVGHGYMDLRFAADSSKETPVVPGQPMLAPLQMMPLDVHVAAGHKLALRILQDAGFDPLPTDPIPFLLNFGSGTKSALRLPVINRTASDLAGGWPYGPKAGLSKPSGGTGDFPLSLGSGAP